MSDSERQFKQERGGGNYGVGTKEKQQANYMARKEAEVRRGELFDQALTKFKAGDIEGVRCFCVPAVPWVLGISEAHNSRSAPCSGACRCVLLVVTVSKTQASKLEGFAPLPWPALSVPRAWAMSSVLVSLLCQMGFWLDQLVTVISCLVCLIMEGRLLAYFLPFYRVNGLWCVCHWCVCHVKCICIINI